MPPPEGGFKRSLAVADRGSTTHAVTPAVLNVSATGRALKGPLALAAVGAEIDLAVRWKRATTIETHWRIPLVALINPSGRVKGQLVLRRSVLGVRVVDKLGKRLLAGRRGSHGGWGVQRVRIRSQGTGHFGRTEPDQRVTMCAKQAEVGIGAGQLGLELGLELRGLDSSEALLAGAKPQEQDLVVLGAFQSESTAVGPVRQDVALDLRDLQLLMQPMRIGGGEIRNQLAEELFEIAHGPAMWVLGQVRDRVRECQARRTDAFTARECRLIIGLVGPPALGALSHRLSMTLGAAALEQVEVLTVPLRLQLVDWNEAHGSRVHAVAQAGGGRTVVEQVTQMGVGVS
jgi:hypothetical protein